jgi:hypothetical protein
LDDFQREIRYDGQRMLRVADGFSPGVITHLGPSSFYLTGLCAPFATPTLYISTALAMMQRGCVSESVWRFLPSVSLGVLASLGPGFASTASSGLLFVLFFRFCSL